MIISASYKTDIPAFYGQWFMNRLRAGSCKMTNPYSRQVIPVDLRREAVEGIVFWTKNLMPFMKHLPEVRERGYPFVIQYGINGYPRAIERSVVDAERSIETFRIASEKYGSKVCVWRYDTIVTTSLTPMDFHLKNFERIAKGLAGATDEVVISFAQEYHKMRRNMARASKDFEFTWWNPEPAEKMGMVKYLTSIGQSYGIQLSLCCQPEYLFLGAVGSRCIDAARLGAVAGHAIKANPHPVRKNCGCHQSRDIGEYDTCPHGCVYCYAVRDREIAKKRLLQHDPDSEFLFQPETYSESS